MKMANKNKKADRKQQTTRIICAVMAGLMLFSVVAAAVFSQVW